MVASAVDVDGEEIRCGYGFAGKIRLQRRWASVEADELGGLASVLGVGEDALCSPRRFAKPKKTQSPVLATLSMGVACAAYATPVGAVPGVCVRSAKAGAVAMDDASTAASAAFVKMVPCFITLSYRLSLFDLVSLV